MRLVFLLLLAGCASAPPTHRQMWEFDPQGHGVNLAAADCQPPRVPYYIYPDGVTPIYLECLREHLND
jgi:hypothetical protein